MVRKKAVDEAKKAIELLLPDENVIGEPFWILMEKEKASDKGVNGTYIAKEDNILLLFISKKVAIDHLNNYDKGKGVVRGVSQKHLKFLINLAEESEVKLCITLLDDNQGMMVEPDFLKEYFLSDS